MVDKLGANKIHEFRRSWNVKPEALNKESPYHPVNIATYKEIPKSVIPDSESLKDTYERVLKYFKNECLTRNASIIYATHIFDNLDNYVDNIIFISNKTCHTKKSLKEFNIENNLYLSVKNKILNNKNTNSLYPNFDKKILGPQGGWSSGHSQNI